MSRINQESVLFEVNKHTGAERLRTLPSIDSDHRAEHAASTSPTSVLCLPMARQMSSRPRSSDTILQLASTKSTTDNSRSPSVTEYMINEGKCTHAKLLQGAFTYQDRRSKCNTNIYKPKAPTSCPTGRHARYTVN